MNVLIVEDSHDIAESIGEFLTLHGYTVDYASDGFTALHLATKNNYNIFLFDISLPGTDGLTLCRRLREGSNQTPVLFITSRDTLQDKIMGFESGGDDYLVKPFQLAELLVRMNAIHKRYQQVKTDEIQVDTLQINTNTCEVYRENISLNLTPVCYKILLTLAQASPNIVSREELESLIWQNSIPESDVLRSHLYTLRRKIDKPFSYPLLHTIPKQGLRLYKAIHQKESVG